MYFNEISNNNITYSVDMIRLKTSITAFEFSKVEYIFKTAWKEYLKKEYVSHKCQAFRYNYNIEIEKGISFYFGFMHNMERPSQSEEAKYNFTIEFNPNKLRNNKIILYLLSVSRIWFMRSLDLAVDLPINILNIVYDKEYKRDVKTISKGYDNKTIYIGTKDSDVSYKIYNKKKEKDLNILGELTRIETTARFEDYPLLRINLFHYNDSYFPCLYLSEYVYNLKDYEDKTLFACLYAIQCGLDFNMLTDHYKKKIKEKLIKGGYKILFDNKIATEVVRNCIYTYFPFLKDH